MANAQDASVLGKKGECHVWRAFPYHEMRREQAFENHRPRGVAQSILQRAKDLADTGIARVSRYEDMLNIFRLGRRILWEEEGQSAQFGHQPDWSGMGVSGLGGETHAVVCESIVL